MWEIERAELSFQIRSLFIFHPRNRLNLRRPFFHPLSWVAAHKSWAGDFEYTSFQNENRTKSYFSIFFAELWTRAESKEKWAKGKNIPFKQRLLKPGSFLQRACYFFNSCLIPTATANRSKVWVNWRKAWASIPMMGLTMSLEITPTIKAIAATMMNKSQMRAIVFSTLLTSFFPLITLNNIYPFFQCQAFKKISECLRMRGQPSRQTERSLFRIKISRSSISDVFLSKLALKSHLH